MFRDGRKHVSMSRECHNQRSQTNSWHRKVDKQNKDRHTTARTQSTESNQLSLPYQDNFKTRNELEATLVIQ